MAKALHAKQNVPPHINSEHGESNKLPPPEPGSVWVHKNGNHYAVLDVSSLPDDAKADEFPVTVWYFGSDGRKWHRTLKRWYGSMTLLTPAKFKPGTRLSLVHVTLLLWRAQRKEAQ